MASLRLQHAAPTAAKSPPPPPPKPPPGLGIPETRGGRARAAAEPVAPGLPHIAPRGR
ncbi:MAG: hypothetical protein U0Y82_01315 [Thermoleophilia bacterium]